ncbi:rod shape-determining protein MreC [Candidatus Pandoraea novymonadis]|uniref:Cell shape-determining protein MreC n=1 Tax=Candidatus Pandoraea novymonadis TaxID=1808959 RepID=A0ABX5FHB7_9BURK|nr:rod shape-determining protein MreC [Candidatus Pandoraea novymonadis]PSB92472.1 Cell shape-determining protein MreC [Candidatus Pandoraea novymonadis]
MQRYSPPPIFKQGPSALVRLIFFVALAIGLLAIDIRYQTLECVRNVIGKTLYPMQRLMLLPRDVLLEITTFFSRQDCLITQNRILQTHNLELSMQAQRNNYLMAENQHLRQLLSLHKLMSIQSIPAEIAYNTQDPFTQRVIIDRGTTHGVKIGAPVVTEQGLIGQVSRVFDFQSEVMLITDKEQAVPVQVARSGVQSVIYGELHSGILDLRFIPLSADVKIGDEIVTSGLDGIYPVGLPVARVTQVDRVSDTAFARIFCQPVAQLLTQRQVLVLQYPASFFLHSRTVENLTKMPDPASR